MLRGILLGSAWGLLLGGGFLAILSLTYPATVQPPPETSDATATVAAPGTGDDTPPAVLPSPLTAPDRHDAARVTRPDPVSPPAAPSDDLASAAVPELSAPDATLGDAPVTEDHAEAPAPETSVLPSPQSMPPVAPAPEPQPDIATAPAQPPRAEPGEEVTGFPMGDLSETATAPEPAPSDTAGQGDSTVIAGMPSDPETPVEAAPEASAEDVSPSVPPATPEPAAEAETEVARAEESAPEAPATPQPADTPVVEEPAADRSVAEAAPEPVDETPAPQPAPETAQTDAQAEDTPERQAAAQPETDPANEAPTTSASPDTADTPPARAVPPTVAMPGQRGIRLTDDAPAQAEAAPAPTEEEPAEDLKPIDRYAAPFENPEGRPILSIVLLDSAEDGAVAPMPARFPYPVSIAIPVDAPDAAERAQRYRRAGYEVLALADLPAGATPADIETLVPAWFDAVPEAVALMERPPKTLQSDRANGQQLADVLAESGHGLLLFPEGLDTTRKLASRQDVPAATVFRDLDAEGQEEAVIRRFLDNSAFKAGLEGWVILVARLRPATIEALLVWGLADRASRVALAPVSAALKAATP